MRERKGANRVLVGKGEGMRPRGKPRRRRKDNIKIGLIDNRYEGADKTDMTQEKNKWQNVVNTAVNVWVP